MHGTDVLRAQCLQVFQQVPLVFQNGLPLIEYLHTVGTYFLQQFLVALGIQRGVYADNLATLLGHLAQFVQTLHHLLPERFIIGPVVAASAKGQENHRTTTHTVHRVETIHGHFPVTVLLGQTLSVETAHGHSSNLHAQRIGNMTEMRGLLWVTQLVVEGGTIAQSAHIEFHTVRTNLTGTGKFT